MKKFLLSFAVVFGFIFYSFHSKTEGNNASVLIPKSLNQLLSTPTPTSSLVISGNNQPTPTLTTTLGSSLYRNGTYTGDMADAYYGYVQIQTSISSGKISDVVFLTYPNDRSTSRIINGQAMPFLMQEAIQAQSSHVDIVTGATDTSIAFRQSLASALVKAR